MTTIQLPAHGWRPRPDQMPLWAALEAGRSRIAIAAHRRWGKDEIALHWAAVSAMQRPGPYWHMLPLANQARKAIWDATNPRTGRRRIDDAFPAELRETAREQDMFIRFKNGSTWQVVGSDNYNALVGSPPVGVVFSEYALADPSAWSYIRPILVENGGWAMFISTPRGRNHFARLIDYARDDPEWYGAVITVEDSGAIPMDAIERERKELRAERGQQEADAIIAQEYYCDFNAAVPGAYYGALMARAEREGRIGAFPFIPGFPVGTAWDIGTGDQTVIWFYQQLPSGRVRIIDVLMGSGVGLEWYVTKLMTREWIMPDHIWPPDGGNDEWGSGKSRPQLAAGYGLKPRVLTVEERGSVENGIQAVRVLLQNVEINAHPEPWPGETHDEARERMARAIDAIRQYRREWDEKRNTFKSAPLHDWCFVGNTRLLTRYGTQPIMSMPQFGEILTSCGWKPYENPRITRKDAPLVEVLFTDGLSVKCTPDHLFKTDSGWRSAESLLPGSRIQSSLTRSRSIGMAACIVYGRARNIIQEAASSCIGESGLRRLERFLLATKSIIETATQPTTLWKILSACTAANIGRVPGSNMSRCTENAASMILRGKGPQNGTDPRLGGYGTSDTQKERKAGRSGREFLRRARTATRNSTALFARMVTRKSIARKNAKWLTIERVNRLQEKADVWCLTVPDAKEFSLSNGAIVHNCSDYADALRYLAIGRRPFRGAMTSAAQGPGARRTQALADYSVLG